MSDASNFRCTPVRPPTQALVMSMSFGPATSATASVEGFFWLWMNRGLHLQPLDDLRLEGRVAADGGACVRALLEETALVVVRDDRAGLGLDRLVTRPDPRETPAEWACTSRGRGRRYRTLPSIRLYGANRSSSGGGPPGFVPGPPSPSPPLVRRWFRSFHRQYCGLRACRQRRRSTRHLPAAIPSARVSAVRRIFAM